MEGCWVVALSGVIWSWYRNLDVPNRYDVWSIVESVPLAYEGVYPYCMTS
jgi:hypothetical protein